MDEELQKIINEQMNKLPKDVLGAIISVDYKTKLQEITKRHRLLIDQAGKLETETTLIMIGLERLADYVSNLQKELGLPLIQAKELAVDVSETIFKPIRESLRLINAKMENGEENFVIGATINQNKIGEANLDRDQILNEIEDPSIIGKAPATSTTTEIETLDELPYQQDIKIKTSLDEVGIAPEVAKKEVPKPSLMETKMAGMTITTQQVVEATPEVKLPPVVEKKRPTSGFDPYREEIK